MSFFSKLIPQSQRGKKNLERGRKAEQRRDFEKAREFFETGAQAFDEHFAQKLAKKQLPRPSDLTMAGICYVKIGRNQDAIDTLQQAIDSKHNIPDTYLYAGYAAAKLGNGDRAVRYWSRYPASAHQPFIAEALATQVHAIKSAESPDLDAACEAVVMAEFKQERFNARERMTKESTKTVPPNRGY